MIICRTVSSVQLLIYVNNYKYSILRNCMNIGQYNLAYLLSYIASLSVHFLVYCNNFVFSLFQINSLRKLLCSHSCILCNHFRERIEHLKCEPNWSIGSFNNAITNVMGFSDTVSIVSLLTLWSLRRSSIETQVTSSQFCFLIG